MGFRSLEIDLHGIYPDEVDYSLGNALRDAKFSGITELTIIHGKGEGILRGAVLSALTRFKKEILAIHPQDGFLRLSLRCCEKNKKIYQSQNVQLPSPSGETPWEGVEEKRERGRKRYLKRLRRGLK